MTDNTGEDYVDSSTNTQPDNPSSDIIPTTGTETITQNQETKNMEVHHHPDLRHKPKKWKEYFLEFLMIFLAVTMGFFAESIREHFGDREKERQNIENVLRCLKNDTVTLNKIIAGNRLQVKFIDSLLTLKGKNLHDSLINHKFYYFATNGLFVDIYFKSNDAAMQQLKSSGTLRLDSRDLKSQQDDHYLYAQKSWSALDQVIDESIFMDSSKFNLSEYNYDIQTFRYSNRETAYITDDPILLRLLFNNSATLGVITKLYISLLEGQLEEAKSIISSLNNEYHIE